MFNTCNRSSSKLPLLPAGQGAAEPQTATDVAEAAAQSAVEVRAPKPQAGTDPVTSRPPPLDVSAPTTRPAAFDFEDLRYLPIGLVLVSLPFAHTVALRLYMLLFAIAIGIVDRMRGRGPRTIPLKVPLALWAGLAIASLAWSAKPAYSLQEVRNEIGYSIVTFLVCYTMAASERGWQLFHRILVASFIGVSLVGLSWFALGFDQIVNAPHGGVGHYTTYLVTILPLLILYAMGAARRGFPSNVLPIVLPLLVLIDGYATSSRAFWPALIVCTLTFALLYGLRSRLARIRMRVLALALMVVMVAGVAFFVSLQQRANVPEGDSPVEALAIDPRVPLWAHVVKLIEERPLTGIGFGRGVYGKELTDHFTTPEIWHAHNIFLNYALQLGIGGVIVLAILLGAIAREFWRLYRSSDQAASLVGLAGIAMLSGFLVKNMTDDFFVRQNALMFWSIVGLSLGYGRWRIEQAAAAATSSNQATDRT